MAKALAIKWYKAMLLAGVLALAAACGGPRGAADPESALAGAEDAMRAGDYESALRRCDMLTDSTAMTVSELCRQAIIYDRLAEATKAPDMQLQALHSLERAYALDPEAVDEFMAQADVDGRSHLSMLIELQHAMTAPRSDSLAIEQEADSLACGIDDFIPAEQ